MTLQPNVCDGCERKIEPDDDVVRIVEHVVWTEQAGDLPVQGPASIYHQEHAPDPGANAYEDFRGRLRDITRDAT
jgi:hypothetical protein